MSAKYPRIHTVLEPPLFHAVERLARRHGYSLSQQVRDLVREALELEEDAALAVFGEQRRKTFDRKNALSVAEVRRRLRLPPRKK